MVGCPSYPRWLATKLYGRLTWQLQQPAPYDANAKWQRAEFVNLRHCLLFGWINGPTVWTVNDQEFNFQLCQSLSNWSCLSHFLIEEIWTAGTALSCSTTWSLFKSNVKSVNSFTLLCNSYIATYFMFFTSNTQPNSLEWKLEEKGFWPQISTNLTKTGHLHFIIWLHPLGYSNQPWGPHKGSKLLRLWIPNEACELKTTTTRTTTTATATTRATISTTY